MGQHADRWRGVDRVGRMDEVVDDQIAGEGRVHDHVLRACNRARRELHTRIDVVGVGAARGEHRLWHAIAVGGSSFVAQDGVDRTLVALAPPTELQLPLEAFGPLEIEAHEVGIVGPDDAGAASHGVECVDVKPAGAEAIDDGVVIVRVGVHTQRGRRKEPSGFHRRRPRADRHGIGVDVDVEPVGVDLVEYSCGVDGNARCHRRHGANHCDERFARSRPVRCGHTVEASISLYRPQRSVVPRVRRH